ncbi:MAG: competence/damage-inducible protein A [Dehalococcoidia bacterium]|nr:competence/damage-inducible protein A [Dehalococcoidia bacterium]
MKAEIISVGTELLLGETIDTNSNFLANEFPTLGIDLLWTTQVGDNFNRLEEIIRTAIQRSDIIFMTGGLGPTEDDITRETLALALNETMIIDKDQEKKLRNFFASRDRQFPEKNIKQASIIKSAKFLDNPVGTAPGWWIKKNNFQIILMPGPPSEMKTMWFGQIKERLLNKSQDVLVKKIIKTSTLGESNINEMIESFLHGENPSVGIYVKKDGVSIRIAAKAKNQDIAYKMIKPIEMQIKDILDTYIWGEDDQKFAQVIQKVMNQHDLTLGIIESASGGNLANEITNIENSSSFFKGSLVAYQKDAKLFSGISQEILESEGTVSLKTTSELAKQAKQIFKADIGLAITGVAGIDTIENKESGTIFLSITNGEKVINKKLLLPGNRTQIKNRAVFLSFTLIKEFLDTIVIDANHDST